MLGDKVKDSLLIYLNDNNEETKGYVKVLELNSGFIKFQTNKGNVITIPTNRLIKLKEFL